MTLIYFVLQRVFKLTSWDQILRNKIVCTTHVDCSSLTFTLFTTSCQKEAPLQETK